MAIPARASRTFFPSPGFDAMPAGTFGSAVVTSDQPIVALVNDVSENGTSDAATYIGLAAGDPEPAGPAPLLGLGLRLDRAATGEGRWRAYLAVGR